MLYHPVNPSLIISSFSTLSLSLSISLSLLKITHLVAVNRSVVPFKRRPSSPVYSHAQEIDAPGILNKRWSAIKAPSGCTCRVSRGSSTLEAWRCADGKLMRPFTVYLLTRALYSLTPVGRMNAVGGSTVSIGEVQNPS